MDYYAADVQPDPVEFPNTIMRRRTSTTQHEDMAGLGPEAPKASDQAQKETAATATTGTDSIAGDVDTCRICRGEGTPGEPLFYPCKCSGSIKYVHQDCLMEWLSHSQKKHCELCKTPFRFTKLYSPTMPQQLPFYVFASHMAKYLFRNVLIWLRAALVMSVWLGWLPYLMRSVWSFLFWISDEGFGPTNQSSAGANQNATDAHLNLVAFTMATQGLTSNTCPSGPLFPATTTPANKRQIAEQIPGLLQAAASPLHLNVTGINSFAASLARLVFGGSALSVERTWGSLANGTDIARSTPQHETLLSEVGFLRNFTPHPAINRIIIRIFEGQIITILVIVCFILIILVRDYVVQQQPEINMRAAFAAQMNNAEEVQEQQHAQQQQQPEAQAQARAALAPTEGHPDIDDLRDDESMIAHDGEAAEYFQGADQQEHLMAEERRQRPIAEFRRRIARRETLEDGAGGPVTSHPATPLVPPRGSLEDSVRDKLLQGLDEESQSTVNQYLRIYRQANGDRDKILRIIRDEDLEERLAYWVNATQAMTNSGDGLSSANSSALRTSLNSTSRVANGLDTGHWQRRDSARGPPTSEHASASDAPPIPEDWSSPYTQDKGKQKAVDEHLERSSVGESASSPRWQSPEFSSGVPVEREALLPVSPTRPRAVSDGPPLQDRINPLANNSWSFSALSESDSGTKTRPETGSTAIGAGPPLEHDTQPGNQDGLDSSTEAIITPPSSDGAGEHSADSGSWVNVETAQATEPQEVEPLDATPEQVAVQQPATLAGRVANFMWGDIEDGAEANGPDALELFIDDQNAPFMELNRGDDSDEEQEEEGGADDILDGELAPDVMEAAAAAGIDPEAIDDAEDFDGVMELLGMRGPIAGLFQNAIFCAFLVSITIFLGIFLPYNVGRLAVWVVANPMRIIHMVLSFSRFLQDSCLFVVGWTTSCIFDLLYLVARMFHLEAARLLLTSAADDARVLTMESLNRIWDSIVYETTLITSNEIRNFSVVSHEALITVKTNARLLLSTLGRVIMFVLGGNYAPKWESAKSLTAAATPYAIDAAKNITSGITRPTSWMINLSIPDTTTVFDPSLAYWGAKDRTLAILSGYVSMSLLAGLYLGRGTPFSSSNTAQEWEASIIDVLNQASGVMKVILIISIEMLVFPLYCGLLLDFALLPLFESTSFRSRLLFTYNYPLTSIFVHWFVGTGYMFHFALFVSMCRKIMRKGVLYFIRDPDDPDFHPVRDVLERNVTTQLRKILFSAFVYGALVVVCLGGVVWGLSLTIPRVLPIHYSSNEPVLEFPIDLLFYNFLMPLAVKFFKPSDGLHVMYTWWFRRCARALSLTWFLFGERRIDEEGSLRLLPDSEHQQSPWYRKLFLQVDPTGTVVPRTWSDMFEGGKTKPSSRIPADQMNQFDDLKSGLVETEQLIPDGRFVRAPASDQVKIPKGRTVFLEVSDHDKRLDDKPDVPEPDLYSGKNYQFVYVPPWFRVRIFLFILFIWLFAAVTGVAFTIIPLVFGRRMFKVLLPAHIKTNDIYAFSIGMYILGSLCYFIFHARLMLAKAKEYLATSVSSMLDRGVHDRAFKLAKNGAKLAYTYTLLLFVFPLAVALLMEFYVMIPLRTWRYSHIFDQAQPLKDDHTVNIVQAWTLGLLYLKIGTRLLVRLGGRPAQAARAVLRKGWMDPDVKVLTRAFVVPGLLLSTFLLALPPLVAHAAFTRGVVSIDPWTPEKQVVAYRMAYPIAALGWAMLWILKGILTILDRWRARVRDEAYLIGERLHNFGGMVGTGTRGATAGAAGEWRGGARL
ncbi:E3 ubiquitin-protein ligase march6 [Seiridium cupressi]